MRSTVRTRPLLAILAAMSVIAMAAPLISGSLPTAAAARQCNGELVTIVGTEGPDELVGTSGNDVIAGLGGNDIIHGEDGDDIICGGAGDDFIVGGLGADWMEGNRGTDTVSYATAAAAVTVNLGSGRASGGADSDRIKSVEIVEGSSHDDRLFGNAKPNDLRGGGGDDELRGKGGDDALDGGPGDDLLKGRNGDDILIGGTGLDTASFFTASSPVLVDLEAGTVEGGDGADTISGVENVFGSKHNDDLRGDDNANEFVGRSGDDVMTGNGGDDLLSGGKGLDIAFGGDGDDECKAESKTGCEIPNDASPWFVDPSGVLYAGTYYDGGLFNAAPTLDGLAGRAGKRTTFGAVFLNAQVNDAEKHVPGKFNGAIQSLNEIWRGEATPFVNLIVPGTSAEIGAGNQNAVLDEWGGFVKRWIEGENLNGEDVPTPGRSLFIAPLIEMNFSNGALDYDCQPASYPGAYRKIRQRVNNALGESASAIRWVFAPNNFTSPGCGAMADYYPGDDEVDVLAMSAYNFGTSVGNSWDPVEMVFAAFAELRALNNSKPVFVSQTGACPQGGDEDLWIQQTMEFLAADESVLGFAWFNFDKECDFRIWDGASVAPGWVAGMADSSMIYDWPLTDLFVPGSELTLP